MIEYTYVIIPTLELIDEMVAESVNEPDTIRYSKDKTQAILKFSTKFPKSMQGREKLSHVEITLFLEGNPDW